MEPKLIWEILVPTIHGHSNNPVRLRHHKRWDQFVQDKTGGLTIGTPAKGIWVSPDAEVFKERVIPVRIMCTEQDIQDIARFTIKHYHQQAVLYYKVTDHCIVMSKEDNAT